MKKFIVPFVLLFILFIIPKDVNASATGLRVYQRNSDNTGWTQNANLNTTCYLNQNALIRGQLLRFDFNDTLTNGTTYDITFNISTQSTLDYAYFRWDNTFNSGGLINLSTGSYIIREPQTKQTLSLSTIPMTNYTLYSKSAKIIFTVTPNTSGTFSLDLPTYLLSYSQICLDGYTIRASNSQANSQDIINNNNSNTQSIINNDNSNTSSIINNQNENTDKEINSQKVCKIKDYVINSSNESDYDVGYLNGSTGAILTGSNYTTYRHTDFIRANMEASGSLLYHGSWGFVCYYDENQTYISCESYNGKPNPFPITIPDNTEFLRFTGNIQSGNTSTTSLRLRTCSTGNQALSDDINDLNNTISDTTIEGNSIGGKLAEINEISDTPISDLLTLPVTILQKLYSSISGSCTAYSLNFGFWGGANYITFPCIDLGHEKYLGRVVWGIIDDLFCIFMVFYIFKLIIWFYSSWTTLTDNFEYLIDPSNRGLF